MSQRKAKGARKGKPSEPSWTEAPWTRFVAPATLGATVLLGLWLRFHELGRESLWLDEWYSIEDATGSLGEVFFGVRSDVHPPGYFVLLKLWMAAFGSSEAAIRSLSAIGGTAAIPVVYLLGRQVGGKGTGIASAALLAVSQFAVFYSQEARSYGLVVLASALTLHGYWLAFERKWTSGVARRAPVLPSGPAVADKASGPGTGAGLPSLLERLRPYRAEAYFALSATLGLYLHVNFAFLLVGLGLHRLARLARGAERFPWPRTLRSSGAVALLFLPGALIVLDQAQRLVDDGFWIPEPTAAQMRQAVVNMLGGGDPTSITFAMPAPLTAAQLLTFALLGIGAMAAAFQATKDAAAAAPRGALLLAAAALSSVLLPFWVSQATTPIFLQRTVIMALPALLVLAGMGIAALRHPVAVALTVVLLAGLGTANVLEDQDALQKEDFRGAASAIEDASPGGAPVFAYTARVGGPAAYYLDEAAYPVTGVAASEAGLAKLRNDTAGLAELWLVIGHATPEGTAKVTDTLDAGFSRTTPTQLRGGIILVHYTAREGS